MSEARNVYPRLCWGCLGVIEDYDHDRVLLDYGGYCAGCRGGELPGLREALRGQIERMNSEIEREDLLREIHAHEPEIVPDEQLSPADLELRRKGQALAERFEQLYQADEGFRRWYHEGLDQIERGEVIQWDMTEGVMRQIAREEIRTWANETVRRMRLQPLKIEGRFT